MSNDFHYLCKAILNESLPFAEKVDKIIECIPKFGDEAIKLILDLPEPYSEEEFGYLVSKITLLPTIRTTLEGQPNDSKSIKEKFENLKSIIMEASAKEQREDAKENIIDTNIFQDSLEEAPERNTDTVKHLLESEEAFNTNMRDVSEYDYCIEDDLTQPCLFQPSDVFGFVKPMKPQDIFKIFGNCESMSESNTESLAMDLGEESEYTRNFLFTPGDDFLKAFKNSKRVNILSDDELSDAFEAQAGNLIGNKSFNKPVNFDSSNFKPPEDSMKSDLPTPYSFNNADTEEEQRISSLKNKEELHALVLSGKKIKLENEALKDAVGIITKSLVSGDRKTYEYFLDKASLNNDCLEEVFISLLKENLTKEANVFLNDICLCSEKYQVLVLRMIEDSIEYNNEDIAKKLFNTYKINLVFPVKPKTLQFLAKQGYNIVIPRGMSCVPGCQYPPYVPLYPGPYPVFLSLHSISEIKELCKYSLSINSEFSLIDELVISVFQAVDDGDLDFVLSHEKNLKYFSLFGVSLFEYSILRGKFEIARRLKWRRYVKRHYARLFFLRDDKHLVLESIIKNEKILSNILTILPEFSGVILGNDASEPISEKIKELAKIHSAENIPSDEDLVKQKNRNICMEYALMNNLKEAILKIIDCSNDDEVEQMLNSMHSYFSSKVDLDVCQILIDHHFTCSLIDINQILYKGLNHDYIYMFTPSCIEEARDPSNIKEVMEIMSYDLVKEAFNNISTIPNFDDYLKLAVKNCEPKIIELFSKFMPHELPPDLYKYIGNSNWECIDPLLKLGFKVQIETVLLAAKTADFDCFKKLYKLGDIKLADKILIAKAAIEGFLDNILNFLIEDGFDIMVKEGKLYEYSLKHGKPSSIDMFLKRGTDPNYKNEKGISALQIALKSKNIDVATHLIKNGAKVNDEEASQCLLTASENGYFSISKFMMDWGAEINVEDKHGSTPLILAAAHNHPNIVQLLLNYNPDINHKSSKGETAFDIACKCGHEETVQILLNRIPQDVIYETIETLISNNCSPNISLILLDSYSKKLPTPNTKSDSILEYMKEILKTTQDIHILKSVLQKLPKGTDLNFIGNRISTIQCNNFMEQRFVLSLLDIIYQNFTIDFSYLLDYYIPNKIPLCYFEHILNRIPVACLNKYFPIAIKEGIPDCMNFFLYKGAKITSSVQPMSFYEGGFDYLSICFTFEHKDSIGATEEFIKNMIRRFDISSFQSIDYIIDRLPGIEINEMLLFKTACLAVDLCYYVFADKIIQRIQNKKFVLGILQIALKQTLVGTNGSLILRSLLLKGADVLLYPHVYRQYDPDVIFLLVEAGENPYPLLNDTGIYRQLVYYGVDVYDYFQCYIWDDDDYYD